MLRRIVRYGEPALRRPSCPADGVTPEVRALVDDLAETMYAAPGVGLAAPQVGVLLRVFVVDPSLGRRRDHLLVMINPEFVERDGLQLQEEGCLSLPGFTRTVARPRRVVIRGLDAQGRLRKVEGTDLLARAFQHEMDHLNGRLFVDRIGSMTRNRIVRRVRKLQRAGRW